MSNISAIYSPTIPPYPSQKKIDWMREKKLLLLLFWLFCVLVYNVYKYFSYENQGQPFMYFKIPRTIFKFCCLPSFIFVWIFLFWRHTQACSSKTMTITMVSKQNKAPPQNVFIITYIKCFIYYVKQLIQMF